MATSTLPRPAPTDHRHHGDLAAIELALAALAARDIELAADQQIASHMPHAAGWRTELHGERCRVHDAQHHLRAYAARLTAGTPQTSPEHRTGGPS